MARVMSDANHQLVTNILPLNSVAVVAVEDGLSLPQLAASSLKVLRTHL